MKFRWRYYIMVFVLGSILMGCSRQENVEESKENNAVNLDMKYDSYGQSKEETPDKKTEEIKKQNDNNELNERKILSLVVCRNEECNNFLLDTISESGIIKDVKTLIWMAPRGGAGITDEGKEQSSKENNIIGESESILAQNNSKMGESWCLDISDNQSVWLRLICEAYEPEKGVNELASKDIMLYIENEDAYIAIQNPRENEKWLVIKLPEYGKWLKREIDMFLRVVTGL